MATRHHSPSDPHIAARIMDQLPSITLLPQEPYPTSANHEALASFRPNGNEVRVAAKSTFSRGTIYIQEASPVSEEEDMPLLQDLYAAGFLTYTKAQKSELSKQHVLRAPPAFDGHAPTNAEEVAQYVRGLAAAYHQVPEVPGTFEIHHHMLHTNLKEARTRPPRRRAAATEAEEATAASTSNNGRFSGEEIHNHNVEIEGINHDDLGVSGTLIHLRCLNERDLMVVFRMFEGSIEHCANVADDVMNVALDHLRECVSNNASTDPQPCVLVSVMGLLVCRRGRIHEVLQFLEMLDMFQSDHPNAHIPHVEAIVKDFTLHAHRYCPISSPVEGYLIRKEKMSISMNEERLIHCMCVSRDGTLVAAASPRGVAVYDVLTSNTQAEVAWNLGERTTWCMSFSDDGTKVLCTDSTGCQHYIFDLESQSLSNFATAEVEILECLNGHVGTRAPPRLPGGNAKTLFLNDATEPLVKLVGSFQEVMSCFTLCSHVHEDFHGTLVVLSAGGEYLSVHVESRVVRLVQGNVSCCGYISSTSTSGWFLLRVSWDQGTWSLSINSRKVELRGVRTSQLHSVTVEFMDCLSGRGHIGSLTMWRIHLDAASEQSYARAKDVGVLADVILHFPLDEGDGIWLKEVVSQSCCTVQEIACMWDEQLCLRHMPSDDMFMVPLDSATWLRSRIIRSARRILYCVPNATRGVDDTVMEVDLSTNCIQRIYRCSHTYSENLYALTSDESSMIVYLTRFSIFQRMHIRTNCTSDVELEKMNISNNPYDPNSASVQWLFFTLHRHIYVESRMLQCLHPDSSLLSLRNLRRILEQLDIIDAVPPVLGKLSATSLMTLAQLHVDKLSPDRDALLRFTQRCEVACARLKRFFADDEDFVSLAAKLCDSLVLKSLTTESKASVLLDERNKKDGIVFPNLRTAEMWELVAHIGATNPTDFVQISKNLLQRCERQSTAPPSEMLVRPVLLRSFVIACAHTLSTSGHVEELRRVVDVFVEHAEQRLTRTLRCKNGTQTNAAKERRETLVEQAIVEIPIRCGFIPLMGVVSLCCPSAVSDRAEATLLLMLRELANVTAAEPTPLSFTTRESCDVFPLPGGSAERWRVHLDLPRAKSIAITSTHLSTPLSVYRTDLTTISPPRVLMMHDAPIARFDGGTLIAFGIGESAFTICASYELPVDISWRRLLQDTVRHLLLTVAEHLTAKPKASEVFVAPLLRFGLTTTALQEHGLNLPGRTPDPRVAEILEDRDEGKEFVDQVCESMRRSIVAGMRPAIKYLLAILVHTGASTYQAEEELKLRWFSGEWGNRMQGPSRESFREQLSMLANWITKSVYFDVEASQSYRATDRRHDSLMSSRSLSERRGSSNTRKNFAKNSLHSDTLEQVRTILAKETSTIQLERAMLDRTRVAMSMQRGLTILAHVLATEDASAISDHTISAVIDILWGFAVGDANCHYTQCLSGAGVDLEMRVREAFHNALQTCCTLLLSNDPTDLAPPMILTQVAQRSTATMRLLGILCHPWDAVDCEMLNWKAGYDDDLLRYLEMQAGILSRNLSLTEPWKLGAGDSERHAELVGCADLKSLGRTYPNDFSIIIPNVKVTRLEDNISIRNSSTSSVVLRADEEWPLTWKDGMPRVFYYEVRIDTPAKKFDVGLFFSTRSDHGKLAELPYYYDSTGSTNNASFPSFEAGDVVGCGVLTTNRSVFFTLNGQFLSFVGCIPAKPEVVIPALRFDETNNVHVLVNFGKSPFCFDCRQLHPTMNLEGGPTWYRVASTAQIVLHHMTTRACMVLDVKKPFTGSFLTHCCEATCKAVNTITGFVMGIASTNDTSPLTRMKQSICVSVAEHSIAVLISTLRHIASCDNTHLPGAVSDMIFDAASVLLLLPLHSIQISTISLLPEIIPHVREVTDTKTSENLVRSLFTHAYAEGDGGAEPVPQNMVPFIPRWSDCDARSIAIENVQLARMVPESQRSIALGNVLPRSGVVSFTVKITRRNMTQGHSLKGGYFVGVAVAQLSPLSPTTNSQSWKAMKPPVVWAMHDTSPQLPYATNPTVKPNNYQRSFGSGDTVNVVVNRDTRSVDFFRDRDALGTLFSDLPADMDLVPFVQLYNEDASAVISPGSMTAPISAPTLLRAASVDVLRAMLTLKPFQYLVAEGICNELRTKQYPSVALSLFNGVPDPRVLQLRRSTGDAVFVTVSRIYDTLCEYATGNASSFAHISNFRSPASPTISCSFDTHLGVDAMGGLTLCVNELVKAVQNLITPLLTLHALRCRELELRRKLIELEKERFDHIFVGVRCAKVYKIQCDGYRRRAPTLSTIPVDFTFSAALSHPSFVFPSHYCGRLATVPGGSQNVVTPFIAIAEPAIPMLPGKINLRCQFIRGHIGQILGGGYYFGVCTANFSWRRKNFSSSSEVWAIHDMDEPSWRMQNMLPNTFPIAADPHCIIVSGDIVRLEIDRNEGTLQAFRKSVNGEEQYLGRLFENIPQGVQLFPFVHLFNTDAVAVLFPSNNDSPVVRVPVQQPHFSTFSSPASRSCDGCSAQHMESRLTNRWFKCNECADFALCSNCFDMCIHSYHAFTEMGKALAHTPTVMENVYPGVPVMIPGTQCLYLRSVKCKMMEEHFNCVAEATEDHALAMWGLTSTTRGQFRAVIDTVDGEPLSMTHPVFIGVGRTDEIVHFTAERIRSMCLSSQTIFSLCSDSTVRTRLDHESRSPTGFARGSSITFDVNMAKRTITVLRDWIPLGTQSVEALITESEPPYSLCCFVLLSKKGMTANILPERNARVLAHVVSVDGGVACVSDSEHTTPRFIAMDDCRTPLHQCTRPPLPEQWVYTFQGKLMQQCQVKEVREGGQLMLHFPDRDQMVEVPFHQLLVTGARGNAIRKERIVSKESPDSGATLQEGFVISRLLLILCCMCENETLSAIVMDHKDQLARIISELSSVPIGNEAPLNILEEIRWFIVATANCLGTRALQRLSPFIPSVRQDSRRRRLKCGVLVRFTGPDGRGSGVHHLLQRNPGGIVTQEVATGKVAEMSAKGCIPLKQAAGLPWFQREDGLPCSTAELSLRQRTKVSEGGALSLITIEGVWQGEVLFPRTGNMRVSLNISSANDGEGTMFETHFYLFYTYARYPRRVRMCLVAHNYGEMLCRNEGFSCADTFEERVAIMEELIAPADMSSLFFLSMDLDAEGCRLHGTCKLKNGVSGIISANNLRTMSMEAPSTDAMWVEPLPDCVNAVIPATPQRDLPTVMHRLIILLARHLFLVICRNTRRIYKELIENISLFDTHPLIDRLLYVFVDAPQLYILVDEAGQLISQPSAKAWNAASLARLITNCLLHRPDLIDGAPDSFIWDTLHSVITAAHRCGTTYRNEIIRNITSFVQSYPRSQPAIYAQLFSTFFSYVDRYVFAAADSVDARQDVAAGVDFLLTMDVSTMSFLRHVPIKPLHCLIDLSHSLTENKPLPLVVELADTTNGQFVPQEVSAVCAFGELVLDELKVGKVVSSICTSRSGSGKYYYEVQFPEKFMSPVAVGWGSVAHNDVPTQHVGSDRASFAFTGAEITMKEWKEEYKIADVSSGSVVGCLLDLEAHCVAWSVNGLVGHFVPIPLTDHCNELYAFASVGSCSGLAIHMQASQFEHVPDGYTDLAGRYKRVQVNAYDALQRSTMEVKSLEYYTQLAAYMSDLEEEKKEKPSMASGSFSLTSGGDTTATGNATPCTYSLLADCGEKEIYDQYRLIPVVESCMATANRFIDLDGEEVKGALSRAFLTLKPLVRRSFRKRVLAVIPPVEKNDSPMVITIRLAHLNTTASMNVDMGLQHSILAQLYKQIGTFCGCQWWMTPLFRVNLYVGSTSHAPTDMGGPYRQLWTLLAGEMMLHPDKCYPHSERYRNPLFRFVNNSQRLCLVPDSLANSYFELGLLNFFGKIMGHAATASIPLDIDFSPFMWKFLIDDELTIRDYYNYVDSVVEKSLEDDTFLLSGVADEIIPNLLDHINVAEEAKMDEAAVVRYRRSKAEHCLVHSMDEQLQAIRSGLWTALPRRVVRCLSWKDLELHVCGAVSISVEDLRRNFRLQLTGSRTKHFWTIVEEMSGEQKSSLLCFACGQRRLPLHRTITITENREAIDFLPRAQSCSSMLSIPQYPTLDIFREKLLLALQHHMEMELA